MSNIPASTVYAPAPPAPSAPVLPAAVPVTRAKAPQWWTQPPAIATGSLMLVLVGIVAWRLFGMVGLIVALGSAAAGLWMFLSKKRGGGRGTSGKGLFGWLRNLLPSFMRGGNGRSPFGLGGGRGPGLGLKMRPGGKFNPLNWFNRKGAPGGGLKGRTPGPGGGGGRSNKFGGGKLNPLNWFKRNTNAGGGKPGGGSTPNSKNQHIGGKLNPLNWFSRKNNSGGGNNSGSGKGATPATNPYRGGKLNPLNWFKRNTAGTPASTPAATTPAPAKPAPPSSTPTAKPAEPAANEEKPAPAPPASEPPKPEPRNQAAPQEPEENQQDGGPEMNATPDDVSLQRYGKNLKLVEAGAEEVRAAYAAAEALKAKFVGSVSRMATVGDDALPASKRLVADVEAIAAKGGNASSSDEWNAVAASAAALHGVYKQEHDTDDARLEGERASRQKEKRADVGYAEQDN